MPRATRKSLADASSPARSSPRAYTKASTAAAGTSSPAKSPGRRGKADEEPEAEMVTESKTRGRSSSRGGGVQTPSPAHSGGSRSRGKSSTPTTMEKKTPPSSSKRGHGKTQKDKEPDEDEDKEQKEEVKKTPTSGRRGRGIEIKDEEPKEKKKESVKKIPPATSRRSRGQAEKEEEPEENDKDQEKANKDEKKILPVSGRRSHGRAGKNEEEEEEAVSTEEVKKTSPASGRRGRGKAKKDEEHKEEENEESKKEEAKKTLQASGRRGRGQAKKDELTGEEDEVEKEGKKTEASGRRGRGKAAKEEEAHEEKADKEEDKLFEKTPTSVRRGRGKDKKDEELEDKDKQMEEKKTPTSDRRGGRERAKQDEPEEKGATEAEEKMDVDEEEKEEELTPKRGGGQSKGGHKISEEQTTSPPKTARASRRSAGDVDVEEKESTSPLSHGRGKGRPLSARVKPTASQSSDGGDASQSANCGNAAETKDKEPEVEKFAEEANKQAEKLSVEQMDSKSEEAEIETEKEAEVSEEKETEKPDEKKATETQAKESKKATEKMEWHAKAKPAEEEVLSPMEEKATPTAEKESRNSETDAVSPRTKSSVKRKFEDEPVEEESESCAVKKARLNGTEPADVEMVDPDAVATQIEVSDAEVLKSYVMVNMEELPAADSAEVAAAVPPPHTQEAEEEQPTATDKVMETDKVSLPCFLEPMVVPLTEAEVAKAYAKEIQGSKGESDDVSSVIVEVGSISGSETFSGLSARGLDTSELQSGSNSIDDDDAADTSVNESALRGSDSELIYPGVKQEVSASIPEPPVTDEAAAVSQLPVSGESSVQAVQHTPTKPVSKGSSSVSPSLGTPDPTFLATYSSPDIFTRAYVPNPAASTKPGVPANNFSIVSYNILAECHRLNSDYSYTPVEYLGLEYRHALLLRELEYLNGDIVCLQEVNPNYFTTTLQPQMKSIGYDGLMKCRTKGVDEGEATFYKCDRFVLEASKEVSLGEAAHKEAAAGGLTPEVGDAVHKYLDRADVILITKLRCKNSGKVVTVGNIHIVYDNLKSPDIQCIQAACAIKEVVSVAGGDGAHIICGDFNSEWSSPVYQLVVDGYLSDSSIHALQAVQRLELDDGAKSLVNHLWRAFQHTSSNLRSAYSTVTKSEPEVTTFTTSMKSAVDYIFYSAGCLIPVGILKTINRSVIDDSDGLPNKYIPSDHLSLKAVISFSK